MQARIVHGPTVVQIKWCFNALLGGGLYCDVLLTGLEASIANGYIFPVPDRRNAWLLVLRAFADFKPYMWESGTLSCPLNSINNSQIQWTSIY